MAAKMSKNGHEMSKNVQTIKCIFFCLDYENDTPKKHLTPFLSVAGIAWAPGAYFCTLIRH